MKITLIGASGFVGTRLIRLLKEVGGYDMKNIDLLPSHFFNDITKQEMCAMPNKCKKN